MPRYSKSAGKDVESAMKRRKKGTLKSGPGGKGGKVKSRKQAIAIGLSEARAKGKKVPKKSADKRKSDGPKTGGRKKTARKKTARKKAGRKKAGRKKAGRKRSS